MAKKIYPYENVILPWERQNVLKGKVPNKPGIYFFYGPNGQLLYTGHASKLRHRVQSYYQEDDFSAHSTKDDLRPHIQWYRFDVMPKKQAMKKERQVKKHALFNFR
jgi:predicted GIY-YIG superfamily endonuclease